jgi:hypothetical protein
MVVSLLDRPTAKIEISNSGRRESKAAAAEDENEGDQGSKTTPGPDLSRRRRGGDR